MVSKGCCTQPKRGFAATARCYNINSQGTRTMGWWVYHEWVHSCTGLQKKYYRYKGYYMKSYIVEWKKILRAVQGVLHEVIHSKVEKNSTRCTGLKKKQYSVPNLLHVKPATFWWSCHVARRMVCCVRSDGSLTFQGASTTFKQGQHGQSFVHCNTKKTLQPGRTRNLWNSVNQCLRRNLQNWLRNAMRLQRPITLGDSRRWLHLTLFL